MVQRYTPTLSRTEIQKRVEERVRAKEEDVCKQVPASSGGPAYEEKEEEDEQGDRSWNWYGAPWSNEEKEISRDYKKQQEEEWWKGSRTQ